MSLRAGEPPVWAGTAVAVVRGVWRRADKGTAAVPVGTGVTGFRAAVVVQAGRAEIRQEAWAALRIFWDRASSLAAVVAGPATLGAAAMAATAAAVAELSGPRLAAMD